MRYRRKTLAPHLPTSQKSHHDRKTYSQSRGLTPGRSPYAPKHGIAIGGLFQKKCHEAKVLDITTNVSSSTNLEFAAWLRDGLRTALPRLEWSFNQTPADVLNLGNMSSLNLMDDFRPDAAVPAACSQDQLVAFAHDNEVEWGEETGNRDKGTF